jgi:esterase
MPFVPPHDVFTADGARPATTVFVCHGILGSRQNWRAIARALVRARPDLRVITLDHRNHGDSGRTPGPATLAACARDLGALADATGHAPDVLIGHSFGGKVVLTAAQLLPGSLSQVWVLDAVPGPMQQQDAETSDVAAVFAALAELPGPFAARADLGPLLRARGFSDALAAWLGTSLAEGPQGWTWRFHLDGARQMLLDYAAADLWPVVEAPVGPEVHLVRAGRSDRWTPELIARLAALRPPAHAWLMPDAGHWLHADDPHGLLRLLTSTLA